MVFAQNTIKSFFQILQPKDLKLGSAVWNCCQNPVPNHRAQLQIV